MVRERDDQRWGQAVGQTTCQCEAGRLRNSRGSAHAQSSSAQYVAQPLYVYKMFFWARSSEASCAPASKADETAFFAKDELPDLPPGSTSRLRSSRAFEDWRYYSAPRDFAANFVSYPSGV